MSAILVNGRIVHYESFGRGHALVFVHGWLGSWRYWVPIMDDLSTDYRTYALDLWGFGDSDKTQERWDIDSYVELLISFMDELGVQRAPLVGHSLGGAIAATLAARYPDRVPKVMAVSLPLTAVYAALIVWIKTTDDARYGDFVTVLEEVKKAGAMRILINSGGGPLDDIMKRKLEK